MNIVIDARILRESTGRYVERLLFYLQDLDTENHYYILLNRDGFEQWQPKAKNFEKVLADYSLYGTDGQFKLARLIKKLKPDLVHYTFQQSSLIYKGKFVITVHDLTQLRFKNTSKNKAGLAYAAKQKILDRGIKLAVKRASEVIVPTHFVAKDVAQYLGADPTKLAITYESADKPADIKPRQIDKLTGKPFILYVGTAHAHKNLNRLVGSYKILKKTFPNLILVIAGKKTIFHERLESFVKEQGVKGVLFTGYVEEDELSWLYENCRAYVFPSLSEGFGLPGLEAMQYYAPVISSNASCLPEVYGDAAYYFDPLSEPDMARAISEVLNDGELQAKLIKNGHRQVKKYSWKKMAEETLAVYKKALSE
jgi:glycosyltransferase involved in cell wall biosynthesis